ncbi:hypothetical protein GMRT_12797 [Giardia muris]|uniref:Uncharacterized protein n=1 Tax=Giardia muris TaxID=5742 RepID=A0A4Z1SZP4_GIAMU|nr:hypothetical protein GMRT_12797 [Giardia muris]|eukprot:TNJ27123.1 hypothetical protein GMRT_12797 [Giardia muris]
MSIHQTSHPFLDKIREVLLWNRERMTIASTQFNPGRYTPNHNALLRECSSLIDIPREHQDRALQLLESALQMVLNRFRTLRCKQENLKAKRQKLDSDLSNTQVLDEVEARYVREETEIEDSIRILLQGVATKTIISFDPDESSVSLQGLKILSLVLSAHRSRDLQMDGCDIELMLELAMICQRSAQDQFLPVMSQVIEANMVSCGPKTLHDALERTLEKFERRLCAMAEELDPITVDRVKAYGTALFMFRVICERANKPLYGSFLMGGLYDCRCLKQFLVDLQGRPEDITPEKHLYYQVNVIQLHHAVNQLTSTKGKHGRLVTSMCASIRESLPSFLSAIATTIAYVGKNPHLYHYVNSDAELDRCLEKTIVSYPTCGVDSRDSPLDRYHITAWRVVTESIYVFWAILCTEDVGQMPLARFLTVRYLIADMLKTFVPISHVEARQAAANGLSQFISTLIGNLDSPNVRQMLLFIIRTLLDLIGHPTVSAIRRGGALPNLLTAVYTALPIVSVSSGMRQTVHPGRHGNPIAVSNPHSALNTPENIDPMKLRQEPSHLQNTWQDDDFEKASQLSFYRANPPVDDYRQFLRIQKIRIVAEPMRILADLRQSQREELKRAATHSFLVLWMVFRDRYFSFDKRSTIKILAEIIHTLSTFPTNYALLNAAFLTLHSTLSRLSHQASKKKESTHLADLFAVPSFYLAFREARGEAGLIALMLVLSACTPCLVEFKDHKLVVEKVYATLRHESWHVRIAAARAVPAVFGRSIFGLVALLESAPILDANLIHGLVLSARVLIRIPQSFDFGRWIPCLARGKLSTKSVKACRPLLEQLLRRLAHFKDHPFLGAEVELLRVDLDEAS